MSNKLFNAYLVFMAALTTALWVAACTSTAHAECTDIVTIGVQASPTPEPLPAPPTPEPVAYAYTEYEWSQDDIDTLAQGYWVWCNTAQEKAAFTMVVLNRVMDSSGLFCDTVEGVMTQSGEFGIDAAHCSDRNRELARVNLNRCMTEWAQGNAGVRVPKSAVYVDRVDGVLTMYDRDWNTVWRCK